jgi:dTDP-4-dehydrorhamnose 3,5-epimerase
VIFTELTLKGLYLIEPELIADERGFFARAWCGREFESHGLNTKLAQCNISFNRHQGTLRGLHYQAPPHEETKVVRVTRGAIYDVAVDLRPNSPTYKEWTAVELTAENRRMFYIPPGFAHGFQTLADDTEVFYQMSTFYEASSATGLRWNDPTLDIVWPLEVRNVSKKDATLPIILRACT